MPIEYIIGTLIALIGIVILLTINALLLLKLTRKRHPQLAEPVVLGPAFVAQIDEVIKRFGAAVQQHTDVVAIVEMIRQLDELDEDDLAKLGEYPNVVVESCWRHYFAYLRSALEAAQEVEREQYKTYGANSYHGQEAKKNVLTIRAELNAAIAAAGPMKLKAV